jgi:glycerophosphoryl diester phosphodiesterase
MSRRFQLPSFMGHPGAAALAPENTLPGLVAAREAGRTSVEVDVMLSKDGVPVLHHDHSLQRTAGDPRQLHDLTAAELGRIDVGRSLDPAFAGTGIPTLAEALDRMGELGLTPNLKSSPCPAGRRRRPRARCGCWRSAGSGPRPRRWCRPSAPALWKRRGGMRPRCPAR